MSKSGIYHLLIYLKHDKRIRIGKLGEFDFPAGYYVYTGSAMNGLESRIARHLRKDKKLHWHIDYLLQHAKVIDVVTHLTDKPMECEYNEIVVNLPDAQIIVPKFGSTDCNRCSSHLVYFPDKPNLSKTPTVIDNQNS